MPFTNINSDDQLVQKTFAVHLERELGWDSVHAYHAETFGPNGTLGRADTREVVLTRDLRAALTRLNPQLPDSAINEAVQKMTRHDFTRSLLGYGLGRSIQLSDEPLIEDMMSQLKVHDYRFSVALETITLSPQFRMIRGTVAARTTASAEQ